MRTYTKTTTSVVLAFLLVVTLTSFVNHIQSSKWKTYKNKSYKFEVKFPARPQVAEEKNNEGNAIFVQHLNDETGQMYYVSVFDSPGNLEIKGLKKLAIETFTTEIEGALLEYKEIDHGKEAVISLGEDEFIIYQIIIVQDKMYQVIATTPSPQKSTAIDKYFHSFKVLK